VGAPCSSASISQVNRNLISRTRLSSTIHDSAVVTSDTPKKKWWLCTPLGAGTMAFNKLTRDHSTMKYADLALAVWLVLTIFGIPARSRKFRDCRWGEHVKKLATSDWQIISISVTLGALAPNTSFR
jgi:hypothetical protein